ncbi:MAG: hypothetical protein QG574_5238 [Cyanobacteriota bacterium erpe_2018_sw_21hr_WHONDRS-SW48-000092_B_bin.40]|jgi:hypothetical protein|nr:hypothetical protein [Cyanobacteriota bacterium erpe_2018_sw_21hr_WHONDRS-SW48-000092_B_bin.40]
MLLPKNIQKAMAEGEDLLAIKLLFELMDKTSRHDDLWWHAASLVVQLAAKNQNTEANFAVLKAIDEAQVVTKKYLEKDHQFHIYMGLAVLYEKSGEPQKSLEYTEKALPLYYQLNAEEQDYELMSSFAFLCITREFYDDAEKIIKLYLPKAKSESPNRMHRRLMAIDLLLQVYEKQKKGELANRLKTDYFSEQVREFLDQKPYYSRERPQIDDWGRDDFTYFIDNAHYNTLASLTTIDGIKEKLSMLNAQFSVARRSGELFTSTMIRKKYGDVDLSTFQLSNEERMEMFFFMRTHASLLGACTLGLAGQIAESYAMMRLAIENSLYAYKLASDEDTKAIWLARKSDDQQSRSAVTKAFRQKAIMETLSTEQPELEAEIHKLYELTIDEGAHPNANTFFKHSVQRNEPGALAFGLNYQDTDYIEPCVEHIVSTGDACLKLFRHIYRHWLW